MTETVNQESKEEFFRTMDGIADDHHCIVRLLGKPEVCMSAPEIMDIIRLASQAVSTRLHELAFRMRQEQQP